MNPDFSFSLRQKKNKKNQKIKISIWIQINLILPWINSKTALEKSENSRKKTEKPPDLVKTSNGRFEFGKLFGISRRESSSSSHSEDEEKEKVLEEREEAANYDWESEREKW